QSGCLAGDRIVLFALDARRQVLARAYENACHLGRLDIDGTLSGCFPDKLLENCGISVGVYARAHLNGGNTQLAHRASCGLSPASRASSLPARSSACRSSEPPTCVSPMNICGKVERPLARWIISRRSSGEKLASCSVYSTPLRSRRRFA